MHGSLDVRYNFTVQFLVGATKLARDAEKIETDRGDAASEAEQMDHRAHVVGAILQATAALESEIWEVMVYGPGHHAGSNGLDAAAASFLKPLADAIDAQRVLERYALVLHVLGKQPLDRGAHPWQDADLVIRLRNEIVHYKSVWASELEKKKLVQQLESKKHGPPPFEKTGIFPRKYLSAACAFWSIGSCAAFLDAFCQNLGFPDRLDAYRKRV